MASLAASAVSLYPTDNSSEFFPLGKDNRDIICRRLKLVLDGQGGALNLIGASALGFTKLLECSNMSIIANNKVLAAVVNPSLNAIQILEPASGDAVDTTADVYLTVTGTAKLSPAI